MLACIGSTGTRRAAVAVVALLASPAAAQDTLSIEVATFEGGRFVIAGTASPGAEVRVAGTDIVDAADPTSGIFRITRRTVLPGCMIEVEAGSAAQQVPVANCREAMVGVETPQPTTLLRPRGGWNSTRTYRINDVVEFAGKHWRAINPGKSRQPGLAGTDAFWVELDPGAPLATSDDPEDGSLAADALDAADEPAPD
ncbi:MAG TPA: hypothetical protein VMP03_07130 [Methylomirabilota bacterium]|nr:hypothetical protein [Methylomirabilota bacterium]